MKIHRPSAALGSALAALVLAAPAVHAADAATRAAHAAPPSIAAAARPLGCLIEPDRVADLGSQVIGVVDQVRVERGDRVDEGQVLATLRAEVETASTRAAQSRAQVDADVLAARANLQLAEQKKTRAEALVAQNFVSEQAAEQARGELEVARQRLAQAESQQQISRDDLRVAQAQRALRTLRSPFAGVVVERYVNIGERVEEKPVMRVAVIDPLRVELMVPTSQYGSLAAGDQVVVHPELPGVEAVTATVRTVDTVLDAASNSFRVRLTLPNPNYRLPAGLRCKADLPTAQAAAQRVPAPQAAAQPQPLPAVPQAPQALRLKLDTGTDAVARPARAAAPSL
jgi:cobalt-zinc-cadmium efflux system membrane fusion protein